MQQEDHDAGKDNQTRDFFEHITHRGALVGHQSDHIVNCKTSMPSLKVYVFIFNHRTNQNLLSGFIRGPVKDGRPNAVVILNVQQ